MTAPKTLTYSSEKEEPLKNKAVVITTIILSSFMVLVTIVNLVVPLIFNHDVVGWINSDKLWILIFGLFIPAVLITIVNGKFESVYVEHFQSHPPRTEQCYCCYKTFPVSEMKVLHICQQCQIEQKVE